MGITFRVDDVEPAKEPPKTTTLRALRGAGADVIALGGDPELPVLDIGDVDPLFAAVHCAFSEHRPLVLTPDAVWLTIARGVAHHVRLNAETLRGRLVRHEGKRTLTVTIDSAFDSEPAWIAAAVAKTRDALAAEIGEGPARLLVCDFSTTTDVDRTASEIILLDTYSAYYDFAWGCICGIPEITIEGTPADWRAIRARIDVIDELDLGFWTASLRPIADHLVEAAEGRPDAAFFRDIYKPRAFYGWDKATGWIARLHPYIANAGEVGALNPLLAFPLEAALPGEVGTDGNWTGPGVTPREAPAMAGSCVVHLLDGPTNRRLELVLEGGLGAVHVDDQGRLSPTAFWRARRASSVAALIERIRDECEHLPAVAFAPGRFPGPAELHALYGAFGSVRFPRSGARMRPFGDAGAIEVPAPGGVEEATSILPVFDLTDGTSLGMIEGKRWARFRTSSIRTWTEDVTGLGRHFTRRSATSELTTEIRVVASSLQAVLAGLLDGDSSWTGADSGTLHDALPPNRRAGIERQAANIAARTRGSR